MSAALDFNRDGRSWPHRDKSHFIKAGDLTFHVQIMGEGEPLLLIHGTGASSHSWRDVIPLLAQNHLVIVPDLPGHAFTKGASRADLSLQGMARALGQLMKALQISPKIVVGHSAGAAIAVEMVDRKLISPEKIVSFNGAFFPVAGPVGHFFSPLAKLIASFSFLNGIFARLVDRAAVERLLDSTGSQLSEKSIDCYQTLFTNESHITGTLTMMAEWVLTSMPEKLKRLSIPLILVKATYDKTVPPETADDAAKITPLSTIVTLKGLGHLAHEERPDAAAEIISNPTDFTHVSEDDTLSARGSA
jgi:magnesium chelatase accessory protein